MTSENVTYPHHLPTSFITLGHPPVQGAHAQDRYENLADKGLSLQLGGKETRQRLDQRSLGFCLKVPWNTVGPWCPPWIPWFHLLEALFQKE